MRFQPGQSGNPAGRPPGALNKKTLAMEEVFAATADETAKFIVARAQCGDATAMRICMERTPPAVEMPPVQCAADAQKALNTVIAAFGRGAITVREFPSMIAAVERLTRTAERIQELREREDERYAKRRVHGVHPDMIPKVPPGWTDPLETLNAALERGENPFPDDPEKYAYVMGAEDLYSPVNSDAEASFLPRAAGEGGDPGLDPGEPGGGLSADANATEGEALYSPVNLLDEPPPGAADAAPLFPCGGGISGDDLYFPVNSKASAAKSAPASANSTGPAPAELPAAPALDAAVRAHADALKAQAADRTLNRRRAMVENVSPTALRRGGLPIPSSFVTDQAWLASLKETAPHAATKRKAA